MDKAVGLAAELLDEYGVDIAALTLVPSSGGVFEVDVDGERLYSKAASGRHPKPGEIVALLGNRSE